VASIIDHTYVINSQYELEEELDMRSDSFCCAWWSSESLRKSAQFSLQLKLYLSLFT